MAGGTESFIEKIQVLLKDVDALRDRIRILLEDMYGEVATRGGTPLLCERQIKQSGIP